jgi:hypothetical protein
MITLVLLFFASIWAIADVSVAPKNPVVIQCPSVFHVNLQRPGFQSVKVGFTSGHINQTAEKGPNTVVSCRYEAMEHTVWSPKPANGRPPAPCPDLSGFAGSWVEDLRSQAEGCPANAWCSGGSSGLFKGLKLVRGPEVVGNQSRCVYGGGQANVSTFYTQGMLCLAGGLGTVFGPRGILCW